MPSRAVMKAKIRAMLQDSKLRDSMFDALAVLELGPCLYVNREDEGEYEIPFADIYCQAPRPHSVSLEEKMITALAWQDVLAGRIIYRFIEVREPPYRDVEIESNKSILDDMIFYYGRSGVYSLVGADFWGGKDGADGYIEFGVPFIDEFIGGPRRADGAVEREEFMSRSGRSRNFPLEVGYCLPDQMVAHLSTSRCVARFPYGHPYIIFLEYVGG